MANPLRNDEKPCLGQVDAAPARVRRAILPRDERPRPRRHNEDVHLTVLDGLPADHEPAVRVWRAANVARLQPPSIDRVARVWEKLAEPEACLVIGHLDADRDVVATRWLNPVGRSTGLERSSPAMATCPWSLSTPTCGDTVSAASCCRDFTSVHPKEAGAACPTRFMHGSHLSSRKSCMIVVWAHVRRAMTQRGLARRCPS